MRKYFLTPLILPPACTIPDWGKSALELIIPAVATILVTLLTTLGLKLNAWLAGKIKSDNLSHVLDVTNEVITSTIEGIITQYRTALLDAVSDGKLDEAEKAKLKTLAIEVVKDRLSKLDIKKLATSLHLSPEMA